MKLFSYLTRQILSVLGMLMLAILVLQFVIQVINEMGDIGKGQYNLGLAMIYSLLLMPGRLYDFLPVLLFMGGLLAFGDLANHNELIVMRSSGFSNRRLMWYLFLIATFLGLSLSCLFEYWSPRAERIANTAKTISLETTRLLQGGKSVWLRDNAFFIHIDEVIHPELFSGVTLYEVSPENRLLSSAKARWLEKNADGWVARGYHKTEFVGDKTVASSVSTRVLPLALSHAWLVHDHGKQLANEMNIWVLWEKIKQLRKHHLNVAGLSLELWQRLSRPLLGVVMLFLSVPFVLGSVRHRSIGLRLCLGLAMGFLYYFINKLGLFLGVVYELEPKLISLVPLIVFVSLGGFVWLRGV